jgi:hypothetical protein
MTERHTLNRLIVAFAVLSAALIYTGRPLMTPAAPFGIVSFQVAFSEERSLAILGSWDNAARDAAMDNLLLDFPYLVVYAWILSLLCRNAATPATPAMSRAGRILARYVWLAAVFDVVENFALLHQLTGNVTGTAALTAGIAACAKFSIIAIALAYLPVAVTDNWLARDRPG